MGILNRDYMKRPSEDDDGQGGSSDSRAEEFFSRFLKRYPRFFIYLGVGLVALLVLVIIIAKLTERRHL